MNATRNIRVGISDNGHEATLSAPAGLETSLVTAPNLLALVRQVGVQVTPEVDGAIQKFVADYAKGEQELVRVISHATPAQRGEDGRVEWGEGLNPEALEAPKDAGEQTAVDHYVGQVYARVKCGQVLGKMIAPTNGVEGRNVRGGVLQPIAGKPARLELDSSVRVNPDGSIMALADGMLTIVGQKVSISHVLDIAEYVDFSTGHVNFDGDVSINRGVKPGFKVKAGGSIQVNGLVEVADLEAGANLHLRTGMAGKHKGTLAVGGDAQVRYLDSVSGSIKGSLVAEKEIVDSKLVIGGDLKCPLGTVFGGEVTVTGSCVIKALGSESYTPTTLVLGDLPLLQTLRRDLAKGLELVEHKIKQLAEQERCIRLNPRPSASERERLTEFAFELSELETARKAKAQELAEIDQTFDSRRRLDVQVTKVIYPNVKLRVGKYMVMFKTMVKGPLSIFWDTKGHLLCRIGSGEPRPLSTIATVSEDPAAAKSKAA
jgi:uncharacterized protein